MSVSATRRMASVSKRLSPRGSFTELWDVTGVREDQLFSAGTLENATSPPGMLVRGAPHPDVNTPSVVDDIYIHHHLTRDHICIGVVYRPASYDIATRIETSDTDASYFMDIPTFDRYQLPSGGFVYRERDRQDVARRSAVNVRYVHYAGGTDPVTIREISAQYSGVVFFLGGGLFDTPHLFVGAYPRRGRGNITTVTTVFYQNAPVREFPVNVSLGRYIAVPPLGYLEDYMVSYDETTPGIPRVVAVPYEEKYRVFFGPPQSVFPWFSQ